MTGIYDKELKAAAVIIRNALLSTLDELEEPSEPLSSKLDSAIREDISSQRTSARSYTRRMMALKRVASILLIIAVGFGSVMIFSEEARAGVYEWFKNIKENVVEYWFNFQDNEEKLPEVEIGYIPEGYVETERKYDEDFGELSIEFYDESTDKYIWIEISEGGKADVVVYEGESNIYAVDINGIEGEFYEDVTGVMNNLIWVDSDDHYIFTIDADLDKTVMLEIARNIVLK